MQSFPASPDFTGLNAPLGVEGDHRRLEVTGTIPADVRGAFFRAVPDPAFAPLFDDDNVLSGDGMVSRILFNADGAVDYAIRYVDTVRHQAEVAAGRALFGRYRNPFTDAPEVAGLDRTVANTTPVWHAGRLLMTKEDGRPYRIDPANLDTLGSHDFGGKLRSQTVTAHVRIDPQSGEMFLFGYEADGLASTKVAYGIVDRAGELVREQWFDAPYCSMMHDFAITEHYALFPVYPTTASLERLQAGGEHWIHELEREAWVGVMPRHGDVSGMRWFKGPKGVSCYHIMNAHEDADGLIQLDQCLSSVNAFPFIQRASGLNIPPWQIEGGLTRWTIDYAGQGDTVTGTVIGPPGDFPVIAATDHGRAYDHGWLLTMNPDMRGPPVMGGPVGAMFNMLLRLDLRGGRPQSLALSPGQCFNEPVHVPSATPGHEGWLLTVVDTQTGPDDFAHALWIVDAGNLAAGPVAQVAIPMRLRPQVHGWWVSAAQLGAAA